MPKPGSPKDTPILKQKNKTQRNDDIGCTPPSSSHKKLLTAVNRQNSGEFPDKFLKNRPSQRSPGSIELDFGQTHKVATNSLRGKAGKGGQVQTIPSFNNVSIESGPKLRDRLFTPNILTENSSYEREKRKIKAELQDSKVYFFNELRNEIDQEERYSQLLPSRPFNVNDNSSFVENEVADMQQDDQDSQRDSADLDLSLSDHITIPGLDTYEVLNTDHDSFLMALEASSKGRPFDPVELDKHAFRESLLLRTEREVGTFAMQKQIERAKE